MKSRLVESACVGKVHRDGLWLNWDKWVYVAVWHPSISSLEWNSEMFLGQDWKLKVCVHVLFWLYTTLKMKSIHFSVHVSSSLKGA